MSELKDHPTYETRREELEAELEHAYGCMNREKINEARAKLDAEFPGWDDENF